MRSNRVQENVNKWKAQTEILTDAYLQWTATGPPNVEASQENLLWSFRVVSFQGQSQQVTSQDSGLSMMIEYSIRPFTHPVDS
jgi:hypothetical protein